MKELYIDTGISVTALGVFEEGELIDSYIDEGYGSSISGNIYKGRIENFVPGLNAAFVNIGIKKNALLQIECINSAGNLKRGTELLVQVIREESGDKGPRVSDRLSIPGRSCVLLVNDKTINISSKIRNGEKRQELIELGESLLSSGYGIIFRTEAFGRSSEDIKEEYLGLLEKWAYVENTSVYIKAPCLVYDSKDISDIVFREYIKDGIEKICTNSEKLKDRLKSLCNANGISALVELQQEPMVYDALYRQLHKYANRRLDLPSGGFVVTDRTEALVVFDVNTGNYAGSRTKEETVLQTNLEACQCIANAIRINNYSGIILIDFIDMERQESQILVIEEITRAMKSDSARHKVYGLTSLGLVEISRERKGRCLRDVLYTQELYEEPSIASMLKSIERECTKRKLYFHEDHITIKLGIKAMEEVSKQYPDFFQRLESLWEITVKAVAEEAMEGFKIIK